MSELLSKFNAGEIIGLVAVLIGPIVLIVAILATNWRRVRIAEVEGALKQQMLDKGMSAAEIEQVIVTSTGDPAVDRAALVQRMVDEGYEGEDIERVLKAYQPEQTPVEEKHFAKHA
jgi:hypothetical protein